MCCQSIVDGVCKRWSINDDFVASAGDRRRVLLETWLIAAQDGGNCIRRDVGGKTGNAHRTEGGKYLVSVGF